MLRSRSNYRRDGGTGKSISPSRFSAAGSSVFIIVNDYIVHDIHINRLRLTRFRYIIGKESGAAMKSRRNKPAGANALVLDDFLCFHIYAATHAFNRVYQPLLAALGLTYPQFIALILLWEHDNQTVGDLGAHLSLQSNTLTPMLKRMETLGYIVRSRDPADERQVRVRLTEAGKNLRMQASDIVRSVRKATGLQNGPMKDLVTQVGALRNALDGRDSR
jgi:MarR family transcriptional regulator, organic hydroperoxide resistance regulator